MPERIEQLVRSLLTSSRCVASAWRFALFDGLRFVLYTVRSAAAPHHRGAACCAQQNKSCCGCNALLVVASRRHVLRLHHLRLHRLRSDAHKREGQHTRCASRQARCSHMPASASCPAASPCPAASCPAAPSSAAASSCPAAASCPAASSSGSAASSCPAAASSPPACGCRSRAAPAATSEQRTARARHACSSMAQGRACMSAHGSQNQVMQQSFSCCVMPYCALSALRTGAWMQHVSAPARVHGAGASAGLRRAPRAAAAPTA